MLTKLRKFLSPEFKEMIMHSFPYRILERIKLRNHKINFSCELTTKCNALCNMCTRQSLIKNGRLEVNDMSQEVINKILQQMEKFQAKRKIYFSPMGLGEPFLFSNWQNLFKKIKSISKNIEIVIATNGILLNDNTIKKLISLEIDEVVISLNANNQKDYKKIMGIDSYYKVLKNTENLIIMRNKSGKKLPKVFVQYLDYDNLSKFKNDIRKWNKIMKYDDKCYVHSVANQAGFYKGKSFLSSKENYPCSQPLWRIAIKINGDIYPCDPSFYSGSKKISSLYIGNIKDTDLFEYFFSKTSKKLKIIDAMKRSDYSWLPECEKCNTYKLACNPFFKLGKRWI